MTVNSDFSDYNADIAIIGLSGRFPGAPAIDTFWHNLCNGIESISIFSQQDVLAAGVTDELLNHSDYVKAGAILDDIEMFDAPFFNYLPAEAQIIDPQQRLFLECAWKAMEHAGYDTDTYTGSIGMYAGIGMNTYLLFHLFPQYRRHDIVGSYQMMIGNDKDFLPTRVSYKLNLKGPSITLQTACSTSLVAVHVACQSLLNGECDMALAGGVSILLPQKAGYLYQPGMILSPDGHCRAFDASAQGTVRGNGLGIVVLKRLHEALADGDHIHAVIKGSAVNNDGAMKIGFTAPNMESQRDVIIQAQTVARTPAETITYLEAHGTGTALGDPIEVEALEQAFQTLAHKQHFCALGSVKTNIGHLDAASGIAGLIKTVLMLEHKQIPPSLHFQKPNPKIDFAHSSFYVNTELKEWVAEEFPRRAGVSSFGIGGTNAHVIVEEAPLVQPATVSRSHHLLVLSAKSSAALERITHNLADYLKQQPDNVLADVAYTLQIGRKRFNHRRFITCQNGAEAIRLLEEQTPARVQEASERSVVYMFPGQGSQYVNMGRQLYECEPVFRQAIDQISLLFQEHLGCDILPIIYPSASQESEASQRLKQTDLAQPALFMIEYALAQLWQSWGVYPQAMIGHSIGEYVAACLAGTISLEEIVELVAVRGRLMQEMQPGAMLAVELSEEDLQPHLGLLSLAAINGNCSCVVSGPELEVQALRQHLEEAQVRCSMLKTSHAFHSSMMEPVVEKFVAVMRRMRLKPPNLPYISNVTGNWIRDEEATDPNYWGNHLRQTVRFSEGTHLLQQLPERIFLEVGPGRALSALARQSASKKGLHDVFASLHNPNEQQSDLLSVSRALGGLWQAGVKIDWSGFYMHEHRQRLPLPTYPFELQRHWVELPESDFSKSHTSPMPDGKRPNVAEWFYRPVWQEASLSFKERIQTSHGPWLIFADQTGLGEQVANLLKKMGQRVVCVFSGTAFTYEKDAQIYTLQLQEKDDYMALCKSLAEQGHLPETVLYCWGMESQEAVVLDASYIARLEGGFYSFLFFVQSLGMHKIPEQSMQIITVSSSAPVVTDQDILVPAQSLLQGACRVIPQEYLNVTCRTIDIPFPTSGDWTMSAAPDWLIAECMHNQNDLRVAYHDTGRWVQRYIPHQLPPVHEVTAVLRQRGVYLITGGLGKIGLVLAEYLARSVQARLVLVSRTAMPDRHSWETWLAHHDIGNEISQKIRHLQTIEAVGGEVITLQADISHEAQMQAVIGQTLATFGAVHGVIHAAGVNSEKAFKSIQDISSRECDMHFRAKLYGTLVLEKVLRGYELDFCLLFSSLSAILGGIAFVAYAAANSFLDAFADSQRQVGSYPWISINWDTWQIEKTQHATLGNTVAMFAMAPEEATDAFTRALASGHTHLINSTGDLDARIRQWVYLESVYGLVKEEVQRHSMQQKRERTLASIAELNTAREYEQKIAEIWQEVLGVEQIGLHENFFELGGTSLIGLGLITRLRETLGIEISPVRLFEAPTVHTLAELIYQERAPSSYGEYSRRGKLRKEQVKRRLGGQ